MVTTTAAVHGRQTTALRAGPPPLQRQRAELLHSHAHLPALDGVRGMAILLVLAFHSFLLGGFRPAVALDRIAIALVEPGWSGVDLFFVLSGFLITGILYDAKGRDGYFRNFYARRILRIFPLYYGFLGVVFLLLPRLTPFGRHHASLLHDQVWYWTYLLNVLISLRGWPPVADFNHFWSLAVEEQFYLVWPFVVFMLGRRALLLACVGIAAGSFAVRAALWAASPPTVAQMASVLMPARMDALAVGALIALVAREPGGLARLSRWAPPAAAAAAGCLGMIFYWRHSLAPTDAAVQILGFTLLAIFYGGLLAVTLTSPRESAAGRLFAHPGLRLLGRYSYGFYVFHLPIIWVTRNFLNAASLPAVAGSELPGQLLFTAVVAAASLGAAALSWHLYESRFLKLKVLFR
ncbi:MAG TPA: acyltransferase [bacterium]